MRARVIIPILLAVSASGARAASHRAADWRSWQPAGPALQCVPIATLRSSHVRDDSTIDFETSGRRTYRVSLPQPCPELGAEQAFSYETSLSQLCSTDIIRVIHQGYPRLPGASCGLGSFQPIAPPAAGH